MCVCCNRPIHTGHVRWSARHTSCEHIIKQHNKLSANRLNISIMQQSPIKAVCLTKLIIITILLLLLLFVYGQYEPDSKMVQSTLVKTSVNQQSKTHMMKQPDVWKLLSVDIKSNPSIDTVQKIKQTNNSSPYVERRKWQWCSLQRA